MTSASLQRAVIVPLVAVSIVATLALGFAEWRRVQLTMEDNIAERGEILVNMIGHAAEAVNAPSEVHRIVSAAGAEQSVVSILFVAGSPPRVIGSTRQGWRDLPVDRLPSAELRAEIAEVMASRRPYQKRRTTSELLVFGAPLMVSQPDLAHGLRSNAVVLVELDRASVRREMLVEAWYAFLGRSLIVFVAACSIAVLLRYRIIQPLEALRAAVRDRIDGRATSIPSPVVIELRQLAAALNDSLAKVAVSNQRLARSESFVRAVIDDVPMMISVRNVDGESVLVNRAEARFCGESPDTPRGRADGDLPSVRGADGLALADPQSPVAVEEFVIDHGGQGHWLSRTRHRIAGPDGDVLLLTVSSDVTEKKRGVEELQRAKEAAEAGARAKSEFLATMSHEIRTPMNGVLGCTELLRLTELDGEQRELVDTVFSCGQHLLTVINDVLDFSKIEAGRLDIGRQPVDVWEVIEDVVALLRGKCAEKGLSIRMRRPSASSQRVLGDPGRLRQVLTNLLGNAVKFTEHGGIVVSSELQAEGFVRISVADTGVGIAAAAQRKLFKKFQQADSSMTRQFGGTGLGLAISKKLIELMGGSIGLQSEPGRGSTFWFELPLVQTEASAGHFPPDMRAVVPEAPAVATPPAAVRGRVLIAEDNAVNAMIAQRFLQRLGVEVDIVVNGKDAVEAVRNRGYLLVLMDCHMPLVDGFAATELIRKNEAGSVRRTPIMALTAGVTDSERERCLAVGMDGVVNKPVSSQALAEALQALQPATASSEQLGPLA